MCYRRPRHFWFIDVNELVHRVLCLHMLFDFFHITCCSLLFFSIHHISVFTTCRQRRQESTHWHLAARQWRFWILFCWELLFVTKKSANFSDQATKLAINAQGCTQVMFLLSFMKGCKPKCKKKKKQFHYGKTFPNSHTNFSITPWE